MKSIAERQAERKASLEKRWKELFEEINRLYAKIEELRNEKNKKENERRKIILAETKIKLKKMGNEKKTEKNTLGHLPKTGPGTMQEYGWYDDDIELEIKSKQVALGIDRDEAIIKVFEAM